MRILHFEYSDFFRRVVHDMTVREGHDYIQSSTGKNLISLLDRNEVDVIFTGMELSDITAEQLIDALSKSSYSKIPVVIITSSGVQDITHRLKNLNFFDFILKENLNLDIFAKCLRKIKFTL
ncbi:MAG: response regulator [Clostridia bacterium]|nr:response regulator [Clostridia bacterium]